MKFQFTLLLGLWASVALAQPLIGTKPLEIPGDLARVMVDGMHTYLDAQLKLAPQTRDVIWNPEGKVDVEGRRQELAAMIGLQPHQSPVKLEMLGTFQQPSLLAIVNNCEIHTVRWSVLPGIDAEGLLIEPKKVRASVIAVPHSDQLPEELAMLKSGDPFALKLAINGCRVLIPTLINRKDELSANSKLGRATNIPHREFIHRMAFELGRTMPGYEVQKIAAAVALMKSLNATLPVGVIGYGDGGQLALLAGACLPAIDVVQVSGYFNSREDMASEPIDRNLWGQLKQFGDAELARLVHPRKFLWDDRAKGPVWTGPLPTKPGRGGAAPGQLKATFPGAAAEFARFLKLSGLQKTGATQEETLIEGEQVSTSTFLEALNINDGVQLKRRDVEAKSIDITARHARQFEQLVSYTQKLWRDSEPIRKAPFSKLDTSSPLAWDRGTDALRKQFHEELIGKLTPSTKPLNPRTRKLEETDKWTSYEVVLDVYETVIAYGVICMPKNMKPGEKRAVVVCQHGLEGRPSDIVPAKGTSKYYNSFGSRLADLGYIVYAPQNPYIFQNHFRQLQRKANPLKLSLFSFIIEQHRRTLDWLETRPEVDTNRIGFYGLSYGGKTAMRVPAVEKRYKFSICSGDFNEWLGKNVTVDLPISYMYTGEYEMCEYNLGHTFNYAEMAYLIAPRPFMVERGHDDGVGIDEMIAYEYAKVRYLYANRLKLPNRTELEFQPGGHEIFLKGTLGFIQQHLGKP